MSKIHYDNKVLGADISEEEAVEFCHYLLRVEGHQHLAVDACHHEDACMSSALAAAYLELRDRHRRLVIDRHTDTLESLMADYLLFRAMDHPIAEDLLVLLRKVHAAMTD